MSLGEFWLGIAVICINGKTNSDVDLVSLFEAPKAVGLG